MATLPQEVESYYLDLVEGVFSAVDRLLKEGKFDPVSLETQHEVIDVDFDPKVFKSVFLDELDKRGLSYRVIETPWYSDLWYEVVYPVGDNKEAHVKVYHQSFYNIHKVEVFLKVRT